jgi:hypothetical protein
MARPVEEMDEVGARWQESLGCHFPDSKIVLRGNTEGVGDAIEKGEQGRDVHRFCDLFFSPASVSKLLHIFSG